MALKIKVKSKTDEVEEGPLDFAGSIPHLVDKAADAAVQIEKVKAKIKALNAEVQQHQQVIKDTCTVIFDEKVYAAKGDDEEFYVEGTRIRMKFKKKSKLRACTDLKLAQKLLGDEVFYAMASVPIKALDDYLTPQQRELVVEITRGDRTFDFEPLTKKP